MTFIPPTRRSVLRAAAAGSLTLPWLGGAGSVARAAPPPRRLLILVTGNGTFPEHFWPRPAGAPPPPPGLMPADVFSTGAPAQDTMAFDLNPIGAPLERHKKDLLYVEGLDVGNCDGHPGTCNILSAMTPVQTAPAEVYGGGITFDQFLGARIGKDNQFPTLQFGARAALGGSAGMLSFYDRLKGAPAENDPRRMLTRLFGGPTADGAQVATARRLRQVSVLDAAMGQVAALRKGLSGGAERAKLDEYLASFRDVETRINRMAPAPPVICKRPDPTTAKDPYDVSQLPEISRAQIELAALAFACDLTRVATFQLGAEGIADFPYTFLDISQGHHDLSHSEPKAVDAPVQYGKMAKISAWHASQIALLVDRLKALPEGAGSVFDSTLIIWICSLRLGAAHSNAHTPVLLIGNAGGALRTGRHLRLPRGPGDKVKHLADLFVTLGRLFGVSLDTFGEAQFNSGPIPGLA